MRKMLNLKLVRMGIVLLVYSFICECSMPTLYAQEANGEPLFTFVQVTDTHIIAGESVKNVVSGIESINLLKPQPKFVVVTGDLINEEKPEESFRLYKNLFSKLKCPFYSVNGNHEGNKEYYVKTIGKLNYSFDVSPYHFIVLDNIDANAPEGTYRGGFTEETVNWLRKHLQSVDRETPLVFFCHASIFRTPSYTKKLPGDCFNYKPILEIVKHHNVIAWLQGHAHCNDIEKVNGVDYITTGCLSDNRHNNNNYPTGYRIIKVYKDRLDTVYRPVPKETKEKIMLTKEIKKKFEK